MRLVYVTKSTLHKIGGILDIPYEQSLKAGEAINKIIKPHTKENLFSAPELKAMAKIIAVNEILNTETADNIKLMNQRKAESETRLQRVIFYREKLIYHFYENCPNLLSDYENFSIPDEIPEHRIDEYRQYFIKNKELFYKDEAAYYARANAFFRVHMSPIQKSRHANSGKRLASSQSLLQSFDDKHEEKYIDQTLSFFQEYKSTVKKYGQASHIRDDLLKKKKMSQEEYDIITEWHLLKSNTKSEIISTIIKINHRSEQLFAEEVMIALGFNGCATCKALGDKAVVSAHA